MITTSNKQQATSNKQQATRRRFLLSLAIFPMLMGFAACEMPPPSTPPANRAPSFAQSSYSFTVAHINTTGIGNIRAFDPDADNTLTYRISSASTRNTSNTDIFAIDGTSGAISIASGKSLALSDSPYTLTVQASDNGSPALTATTMVSVDLSIQSMSALEDTGTLRGSSLFIGRVQANPATGSTLSYSIHTNSSNIFEIDSSTGVLSLIANQCLDFSVNPRHNLVVAVNDGENTNLLPVSVEVVETPNRNLCGDISSMAPVIDGTASPFFYGGNGTQANPYIIPISRCCADFTLTYDPNYTSSSPNIYFQANLLRGAYAYSIINTELFATGEPVAWLTTVTDQSGVIPADNQGFVDTEARVGQTENFNTGASRKTTQGIHTIHIFGDRTTAKWLSKKGFRFQRQ